MLTLQSSFEYLDTATPPVDQVEIDIKYPRLSLNAPESGPKAFEVKGHGALGFEQALARRDYQTGTATAKIFGPNFGRTLEEFFIPYVTSATQRLKLTDLTIPLTVNFGDEEAGDSDGNSFEGLFFVNVLKWNWRRSNTTGDNAPVEHTEPRRPNLRFQDLGNLTIRPHLLVQQPAASGVAEPAPDSVRPPAPTENPEIIATPSLQNEASPAGQNARLNALVEAAIYMVNKKTYLAFLHRLFPNLSATNETILLYVINLLVDLTGKAPTLVQGSESAMRTAVQDLLVTVLEIPTATADAAYDYITANFSQLFDFPLRMPKIKMLDVAGVVRFNKPPGFAQLSFNDVQFCHLRAEFEVDDGGERTRPKVSRFAWVKAGFVDEQMKFSFKDVEVRNRVKGAVTVTLAAFDNTEVWSGAFKAKDPGLQRLDIVVDLKLPGTIDGGPATVGGGSGQSGSVKLRGKVVSLAKSCTLAGTIVIQARKAVTGPWITVATGKSEKAGNFAMPYPYGQYVAAQALISLEDGNTTPISTDSSSASMSISTDFIYILLQGAQKTPETPGSSKEDACGCKSTVTAGRLPSQEDLLSSDQFTQDVGGTCINLTVPNRTLREFNYQALVRDSDPDVANYTLSALTDADFNKTYFLSSNGKVKRKPVDLDNPILWQDVSEIQSNLALYQAVTVSTGHILHYKSEFKADGYSLGDLLYSVPLAPGQKKQIVVIDSSHSLLGSELQEITQTESVAGNLVNDRDIVDQIAGTIGEALQGNSSATTSGVSAGAGASGSAGAFGASLGVAGGYANANSNAAQNSSRNMSQFFHEKLKQSINQNASGYRKLNASAVTSVQEGQKYNAETDVIANHNHCHSVTMMYFEVLRHFAVYQELVDVEECVFVPLLMTKFSMENVSRWADVLAQRLLPLHSNTYLKPYSYSIRKPQHPLIPAFDAVERINTKYMHVDYPKGTYDDEVMREIVGNFYILTELPRPKSRYDFIMSLPIISKSVSHEEVDAGDALKTAAMAVIAPWSIWDGPETHTVTEQVQQRKEIFDGFMSVDANFQNVPPAQCIRIHNFATFNVAGGTAQPLKLIGMSPGDRKMWEGYATCLGYAGPPIIQLMAMLDNYFKDQLLSEWDEIFQAEIAPQVFKFMVKSLYIQRFNISPTVLRKYNGGERYMEVAFRAQTAWKRNQIGSLTIGSNSEAVKALDSTQVNFTLAAMKITYSTDHFHGVLYDSGILENLLDADGVTVDAPENAEEKRDPRKEDIFLANRLIQHLNCNLEYYNRMLWYSLDAQRRWLLLDGFNIQTYLRNGMPDTVHSLASVLKNSLIAVAGNSLVFPVAPGFHVSQSLIVRDNSDGERPSAEPSLLDHYRPREPSPPYRLSVPNRGVYAEAVMGACDSCEKVQPDTSQDWTKFGTDEPTAIATVQPVVPTITDWRAAFKDFATPMIQMQNAPAAPDPGAGLAAATDLLGKSGLFKDITGLDANQANAIKTYLSNNENVKALASMSSALAQQSHNTQNSAKIVDNIQTGKATGDLTKGEASKLMKQHIQQQIGGDAMKADLDKEKPQKPSLSDAMVGAVEKGKDVKAVVTDGQGGSQSIEVKGVGATGQTAPAAPTTVPEGPLIADVTDPPLEVVKQTGNGCWAFTASVMLMWKLKKSLTALDAVKYGGDQWAKYYDPVKDWQGIMPEAETELYKNMGLVSEPLADYQPQFYVDLMKKYGPIWLVIDSDMTPGKMGSHAKVLSRISGVMSGTGDGLIFTYIDPAYGTKRTQTFKDFMTTYQQELTDLPPGVATPHSQLTHWPDEIPEPPTMSQNQTPWQTNNPLLQRIAEAAFLAAHVTSPTPVDELMRGAIWPDDPTALLFLDRASEAEKNWIYSNDLRYLAQFTLPDSPQHLLGRVLKGDLQFLHAMAKSPGEAARITAEDMTAWLEVMYRLSIDQGIKPDDAISTTKLKDYFSPTSRPTESQTLGFLLRGSASSTKYAHVDISRRALGVCLHILASSYAPTHVRRKLLNPDDLLDPASGPSGGFKAGTWGKYGAIENFWSLRDQTWLDPLTYPLFDGDGGPVTASDLGSFVGWNGARDAVEAGRRLLEFWTAKTGWEAGVSKWIEEEVLIVPATATPAAAWGS